ncbi:hypothetical protein QQP08_026313 [Theobroma cacao]|nr:hypothetical protein QQP08_026313 [Theobroma cacao]
MAYFYCNYNADFISFGPQSGWVDLINAAAPETCGQAIEVPDIMLKRDRRKSNALPDGPIASVHAPKIFTPGARISGFRIPGTRELGPLDEKEATIGAGFACIEIVPCDDILAIGFSSYKI